MKVSGPFIVSILDPSNGSSFFLCVWKCACLFFPPFRCDVIVYICWGDCNIIEWNKRIRWWLYCCKFEVYVLNMEILGHSISMKSLHGPPWDSLFSFHWRTQHACAHLLCQSPIPPRTQAKSIWLSNNFGNPCNSANVIPFSFFA